MKEIIIIGAGNFGRETSWLIEDINKAKPTYNLLGFLDDTESKQGEYFNGYKCIGKIPHLLNICQERDICAVIAMEDCAGRKKITDRLTDFTNWETIIHPSANIADSAQIGQGCIICANTSISVNTTIKNHCVFNIGAIIGHDVSIGSYVSIMSGACVCGNVQINDEAYIATNCSVLPRIKIGSRARIGAGSTVLRNVKDATTVMGVPAKVVRF